jgi:type IV pilus assembly protein PilW
MMRPTLQRLKQAGLSLVEMMVGLAIGLFLTLGLFTLISNTSNAFKVQDDFARMQDNAATAMRYIGGSLRMAGFYGYAQDQSVINTTFGGVATTTDCGSATNTPTSNWALNLQLPIYGFAGLTPSNINTTLPCIAVANYLAVPGGQQILVTRGAIGYRIPDPNNDGNLTDGLAAQRNYTTTVYVQADPGEGLIFYGADFANLRAQTKTRTLPNGRDIDIFEYAAHVYYIRPCSRILAGTTCNTVAGTLASGTQDDGHPIPTLVRQELQGSVMTEVALAEGIERMSILYGIDNAGPSGPDGVADIFTATPAVADWGNIVAVRVSLLVRSPTLTAQHNDGGKSYDLDGDTVADYTCTTDVISPTACNYKRKVFSQLFQLRNISQRRGL